MNTLEKEIRKLPRNQKLSIMEFIWMELLQEEDSIQVPEWHIHELEATEKDVKDGNQCFEDWEVAKEAIRRV